MKKRLEDMQIGDDLCDMHNGFSTAQMKNEVIETILLRFPAVGGCAFISKQLEGSYLNKILVMVDNPEYDGDAVQAVFAYSYDDRTFGVVRVRAKCCPA